MRTRLLDLDSERPADLDRDRSPRRREKGFWKPFAGPGEEEVGEWVWERGGKGDLEAERLGGSSAVVAVVASVREAGTPEGIGSEGSCLGVEDLGAEGGAGFTEEGTGGRRAYSKNLQ